MQQQAACAVLLGRTAREWWPRQRTQPARAPDHGSQAPLSNMSTPVSKPGCFLEAPELWWACRGYTIYVPRKAHKPGLKEGSQCKQRACHHNYPRWTTLVSLFKTLAAAPPACAQWNTPCLNTNAQRSLEHFQRETSLPKQGFQIANFKPNKDYERCPN
eukprot:1141422-Pelagomonas_calceolata.AAC.2